ncbi:MAG: helix-turn-helix domain-containing protein [Planctomycetaceae bacterium]
MLPTPLVAVPDEILTIKDVASLLKLADKTVYAMANAGEIPAFKVRGQWRLRRADVVGWIQQQVDGRGRGDD